MPGTEWVVVVVANDGTEQQVLIASTRLAAAQLADGIRRRGTDAKVFEREVEDGSDVDDPE